MGPRGLRRSREIFVLAVFGPFLVLLVFEGWLRDFWPTLGGLVGSLKISWVHWLGKLGSSLQHWPLKAAGFNGRASSEACVKELLCGH